MHKTLLSRDSPIRRLHECIIDSNAYDFWEKLCEQTKNRHGDCDVQSLIHDIKSKKMTLTLNSHSNKEIKLKVENMVMRMELQRRSDITDEEKSKMYEHAQTMSFGNYYTENKKTDNHQPTFTEIEKNKFLAYMDLMKNVVDYPGLIQQKDEQIMSTNSETYVTQTGSLLDTSMNETRKNENIFDSKKRDLVSKKTPKYVPFRINLEKVALYTNRIGSQFNKRKFSSVSCRFFPLTIGIFPYGRISSTGSVHEIASLLAFQYTLNILRDIEGPFAFEDPYVKLTNLVLSGSTGYPLRISLLLQRYPSYITRIRRFSGISFVNKNREDKSTILIFITGSFCSTGSKSINEVKENMKILLPMLESCRATQEDVIKERNYETNIATSWPRSRMNNNLSTYSTTKRGRKKKNKDLKKEDQ